MLEMSCTTGFWGNAVSTESLHRTVPLAGVANAKIGNATASLPEYLAKKAHLSMHVELTSSIFQRVNERDLISLGRLEQELVFGEKKSNDIILHLQGWNARRCVSSPKHSGAALLPSRVGTAA